MAGIRRTVARARNFLLRLAAKSREFPFAREAMLASDQLSSEEKRIFEGISLQIHPSDDMYVPGKAQHYLSVGLSALRCLRASLKAAGKSADPHSVLDFPCGHGRVARFLRSAYPSAKFVGGDVDKSALRFCKSLYSMDTFYSMSDFDCIDLGKKFDLVWCGSLATHIDETRMGALLRFFRRHLANEGVCVFTTHGRFPAGCIRDRTNTYGLTSQAQQKVLQEYDAKGFGYADYPGMPGYGISLSDKGRVLELARKIGGWREALFMERGWDNHQDVFAFCASE